MVRNTGALLSYLRLLKDSSRAFDSGEFSNDNYVSTKSFLDEEYAYSQFAARIIKIIPRRNGAFKKQHLT